MYVRSRRGMIFCGGTLSQTPSPTRKATLEDAGWREASQGARGGRSATGFASSPAAIGVTALLGSDLLSSASNGSDSACSAFTARSAGPTSVVAPDASDGAVCPAPASVIAARFDRTSVWNESTGTSR